MTTPYYKHDSIQQFIDNYGTIISDFHHELLQWNLDSGYGIYINSSSSLELLDFILQQTNLSIVEFDSFDAEQDSSHTHNDS